MRLALALVGCLLVVSPVGAAPGDVDPTFGGNGTIPPGFVVQPIPGYLVDGQIQPDGRILTLGETAQHNSPWTITLMRLEIDGALDLTFGSGGIVTTPPPNFEDSVSAMTLQPDGRVIVVGEARVTSDHSEMLVLRYLPDGTLDPSFGAGGLVRTSFGPGRNVAAAVVYQPNGKIVVAGSGSNVYPAPYFAMARFESDGSPDLTFGSGGKVISYVGTGITGMVLQPDGKLVVAGNWSSQPSTLPSRSLLARYRPDGTLDPSFGFTGIVSSPGPGIINGIALQTDGKIVGVGSNDVDLSSFTHTVVIRLDSSGGWDETFGNRGFVEPSVDGAFLANGVVLEPDGRIVTAGERYLTTSFNVPGDLDAQLLRFDSTGVLDPGFGVGGSAVFFTSPTGRLTESWRAVRRQFDGKIVAFGSIEIFDGLVARYESTPAACGNGVSEPGETCDDGNTAAGDGCDASCIVEPGFACAGTPSVCTSGCGDGVVGGSEECDDGNLVDGDGCDATCRVEPGWTCAGQPSSCTPVCGDSRVVGDEECDDGNTRDGDCCDASCHFEPAGSPCLDDGDICSTDVCGPAGVCEHVVQPDPKLCPSLCGDGRVTGNEQCDDGNTADDCCDSNCQLEPAGSPCADDGDLCSNDTCNGTGVCQHQIGPDPACFVPIPPAAASLSIHSGYRPHLDFDWTAGPAVAKATFGMPDSGTPSYALCVYDERAGTPTLALAATASGDSNCADRRCWKARRRGWRLENASGVPSGIVSLYLDAGPVDGRSRVRVRMKGQSFSMPSLPLASDPTVQVQLRSSDRQCYGAAFSMPTKNDDLSYRAKSD